MPAPQLIQSMSASTATAILTTLRPYCLPQVLNSIVKTALTRNPEYDIGGVLIYDQITQNIIQTIEGPEEASAAIARTRPPLSLVRYACCLFLTVESRRV